ncbi:MAG: NUDIX hydrolase [Candidatus Staskawiczbacteria bacterium]
MNEFNFLYCQKIVVFSKDLESVLLCKRKGENDYDGVYSFIGGKMEIKDGSFVNGLEREKNEEVGKNCKIRIYTDFTTNILFTKKSGDSMVLPHYFAEYIDGEIILNEEYSDYKWVKLEDLKAFEPKIPTIPSMVDKLLELKKIISVEQSIIV